MDTLLIKSYYYYYYLYKRSTTGIGGVNLPFDLFIHVSKSQIKISRNPLFHESHPKLNQYPKQCFREKKIGFGYGPKVQLFV